MNAQDEMSAKQIRALLGCDNATCTKVVQYMRHHDLIDVERTEGEGHLRVYIYRATGTPISDRTAQDADRRARTPNPHTQALTAAWYSGDKRHGRRD